MRAATVATVAVAAVTSVAAQNSSSTYYTTEFFDSCSTSTGPNTVTATDIMTIGCPVCEAAGLTGFPSGTITTYVTVLPAICSTSPGIEQKTYTITEPCPSAGLPRSADYVPQGFVTTTAPCGCPENTPVPVTQPGPRLASALAKNVPGGANAVPTAAPGQPGQAAPVNAPGVAPAPTEPAGAPGTSPAGSPGGSNASPGAAPGSGSGGSPGAAPGSGSSGSSNSPGGAPAQAPAVGDSSSSSPANAAPGGSSPGGSSPGGSSPGGSSPGGSAPGGSPAGGSSPGAPAGAPAAKYPSSPSGAPVGAPGSASPSGGAASNGTVPFLGRAVPLTPGMSLMTGFMALVAAFRFAL